MVLRTPPCAAEARAPTAALDPAGGAAGGGSGGSSGGGGYAGGGDEGDLALSTLKASGAVSRPHRAVRPILKCELLSARADRSRTRLRLSNLQKSPRSMSRESSRRYLRSSA